MPANQIHMENLENSENVNPATNVAKLVQQKTAHGRDTVKAMEHLEPLLLDNPNRFVLFPIKYHEVRVPMVLARPSPPCRSGTFTRRPRRPSGRPRRST